MLDGVGHGLTHRDRNEGDVVAGDPGCFEPRRHDPAHGRQFARTRGATPPERSRCRADVPDREGPQRRLSPLPGRQQRPMRWSHTASRSAPLGADAAASRRRSRPTSSDSRRRSIRPSVRGRSCRRAQASSRWCGSGCSSAAAPPVDRPHVQPLHLAIGRDEQRRRVPGRDRAEHPGRGIEHRVTQRRHVAAGRSRRRTGSAVRTDAVGPVSPRR